MGTYVTCRQPMGLHVSLNGAVSLPHAAVNLHQILKYIQEGKSWHRSKPINNLSIVT